MLADKAPTLPPRASQSRSGATVLTSAENIRQLNEKERKKKEEEERKLKRKDERKSARGSHCRRGKGKNENGKICLCLHVSS